MNIIITQRHSINQYGDWIDSLENNYVKYFESYDINLIPVSNCTQNVKKALEIFKVAGIILSGGGDVSPLLYGGRHNDTISISEQRDTLEYELLDYALKENLPVLGICRGMHTINVYFGGELTLDITLFDKEKIHTAPGPHPVEIVDQRFLEELNIVPVVNVNSYHNQGILASQLSEKLTVFALDRTLDLVEGFYHQEHPIAGIQWHPERPGPSPSFNTILIKAFIARRLFWGK